ncbi:MAG TPA: YCF48-related protein [Bacteroidota bacterium]|nr:YCF48-related protein [Bacteroidota bacterium]
MKIPFRRLISLCPVAIVCAFFLTGCPKETAPQPVPNQPPRTYLWLFPDSTIAEGHSRQHIRWWATDHDGIVTGYLFASGRLYAPGSARTLRDTIAWRWTTGHDSVIAFPLLVRRDTFQIAVRAVDNSLEEAPTDHAVVRFVPSGLTPSQYSGPPFWDRNEDGQYDAGDVALPSLIGAVDPAGAGIGIPVLNQPPSVVFAENPNDPGVVMQQPDTTYTAATFSWVGSDPDGDQTIESYQIALNDPTDPTRWFTVPGNIRLVSLVVPRDRSNPIIGIQEVAADVWVGTFATTRSMLGSISHLKLDTLNKFYVRARDIAGDTSRPIVMPSDSTKRWFVKNPRGRLLVIDDYISFDRDSAVAFYRRVLPSVGFPSFELLNIGLGLTAQLKNNSRFGRLVPPFLDPAFIYTLHLFDVVVWYTDEFPSLGVAQYPLFEYVRDASHRGKVIFSTLFATSSDPRGALTDFSPLDGISSVSLNTSRLLPTPGDTRVPGGYVLVPDSSDASDIFSVLKFNNKPNHSVFMRPVFKRSDARYIYHIQRDARVPLRYAYTATLNDLQSVSGSGGDVWAAGINGTILHTSNSGQGWTVQTTGTQNPLFSIQFLDAARGWAVGGGGAILQTQDGGASWSNQSVVTLETFLGVAFSTNANGVIVGTNGLLIHTSNAGGTWLSGHPLTGAILHAASFVDQQTGIAVGDGGTILKTTDAGVTWRLIPAGTSARLNGVRASGGSTVFAVGSGGTILQSTDAGESWIVQPALTGAELRSVFFTDPNNGWISGTAGTLYRTQDGGASWIAPPLPFGSSVGQHLNGVYFADTLRGWCVATGGVIIHTETGGIAPVSGPNWLPQPDGDINVGVIDGVGMDGKRSFVFLGLPLHLLDAQGFGPSTAIPFLQHVLRDEFGQ